MNENNLVTPEGLVVSLPEELTFIEGDTWQDCLTTLNRLLLKLNYPKVAIMTLKRSVARQPKEHKQLRSDRPTDGDDHGLKKLYCTRCSTYHKKSFDSNGETLHFGVVGTCTIALSTHDGKDKWALRLMQLFPHYRFCTELTNETIIKNANNCFKIPVDDIDLLTQGIFKPIIENVKNKTINSIHNPENEIAKFIKSGLGDTDPLDRRYLIPLGPLPDDDTYGNRVRSHHNLDHEFEERFNKFIVRFSLIIANYIGIHNQMFFQTPTHPNDTIQLENNQHLHIIDPAILIGGYMSTHRKEITHQIPHVDTGNNSEGLSVLENEQLRDRYFPFTAIFPIDEAGRTIHVFDSMHESAPPKELHISKEEICIIPANVVHAGITHGYVKKNQCPELFPALHMYMQSTNHDFDTGDFVPSLGHAIKYPSNNHYLSNMPAHIVREFIDLRVEELMTILQKVNVESALEESDADDQSVEVINYLCGLIGNRKNKKKRRQR